MPAPEPDGSVVVRCTACGSTVSRAAGRWYSYGVQNAVASASRAAKVRAAQAKITAMERTKPSRTGGDDE